MKEPVLAEIKGSVGRNPEGEQQRLHSTTLRDQAKRAIRDAIITGAIEPGRIYSAPTLAENLGVSATPVREALLDLAAEELVEPVRNRGFRVIGLSDRDIDDIFELRQMLEPMAMIRVIDRLTPEVLERFGDLGNEMTTAAEAGDLVRYLDANRAFHLGLLGLLGNQRLVDAVARLRDHARLYRMRSKGQQQLLVHMAARQRDLLGALARGERKAVRALMTAYLEDSRTLWGGEVGTPRVKAEPAL